MKLGPKHPSLFVTVALPAFLVTVPALPQTTPTRPAACTAKDPGYTATFFGTVSSDSDVITVTFADPDPESSLEGVFSICGPLEWNGAYNYLETTTKVAASGRAGSTVTFGPGFENNQGASFTLKGETDYWLSFGDFYTAENPWTYVRTGPAEFRVEKANVNETGMIVLFNRDLGIASVPASAFTVKKTPPGGTEETVSVSLVVNQPRHLGLNLASRVAEDDVVTLSYQKPTEGSGNRLVDADGKEALEFTDFPVGNSTLDGPEGPVPDPSPPSGGGAPPDNEPGSGPESGPEPQSPSPIPPEATFTVDVPCPDGLCRARTGEGVTFTDTSSGTVSRRFWDFDSTGRTPSGKSVTHDWESPGFYRATLTVEGAGVGSSASRMFRVDAADPAGSCVPGPETLCLQDSRYEVRVEWQHPDGGFNGARVVHAGTNDSGLFRFFDGDNWEMLIKVLDGCSANGHAWVFGGSTTDLGYVIRVTDTATGAVKEYRNEPGTPAAAITDALAFPDGCRQ